MDYAIYRVKKLSNFTNIASSLHHTFRSIPTPNADIIRTKDNKVLCGSHNTNDVLSDIKKRIAEITDKPRKNAVLTIEQLQTYSPQSNIPIEEWAKKNTEWNIRKFGKENIISSVLHLDETTPHIVTYIVPELNNKLNCKGLIGGREKLSNLQTEYAEAMNEFGLARGIKGSRASHTKIKAYYESINKNSSRNNKDYNSLNNKINSFPKMKWNQTPGNYNKLVDEYFESLKKDFVKVMFRNSKLSNDNDAKNKKIKELSIENGILKEQNEDLTMILNSTLEDLNISKDEISILRKIDISLVASRLNYYEEIPKKFNAIDLVKHVNKFNYEDSVKWLYNEFGSDVTAGIIASDLSVKKPERPFTEPENKIKQNVIKQLDALGCDKFRITLQSDETKPYVLGKSNKNNSIESFYSKKDVVNLIPFLLFKNNKDKMNVLVTPMDDNSYYILVDDCKKTLEELELNNYKPCLYQSTSWNSYQAVFKIPKDYDRATEVLPLFNEMNKDFGDEKMTGLRHPFRLAGFRNMKPKHERENGLRPFVTLEKAVNRFCSRCMEILNVRKNNKEGLLNGSKPRRRPYNGL